MRYELSDYERTAIKPMLPNKPHGVRPVNDRRVLNGIFCFHKRCYSRIVDTMRIRNSLASKRAWEHSAKTKSQRLCLLQPVSVPRARPSYPAAVADFAATGARARRNFSMIR